MKKENKSYYSAVDALGIMARQFIQTPEYILSILTGFFFMAACLPTFNPFALVAYFVLSTVSGYVSIFHIVWSKNKVFESLGFDYSKGFGRARWLVSGPHPLQQSVLRISSGGYAVKDFEAQRDQIAMRLLKPIKDIRQPVATIPTIEIELLESRIPDSIGLLDLPYDSLESGEFFIGMGDGKPKKMTLTEMVHMLFAGQTGMGKTSFMKQFMTTILARTRDSHVILIDMKGGIDFQAFENLPNLELVTSVAGADASLVKVRELFEKRRDYLLKKKKERWIDLNTRELREDAAFVSTPIGPVVVIVDELAELVRGSSEGVGKAAIMDKLEKLAQLARFTGIHLVLGTQRPDKSVISMQIKDNMGTRVCFSVPSIHASTLVINDMSASTLGSIPGRAVCVAGGSTVVQCPAVSNDTIKMLLEQSAYLREARGKPLRAIIAVAQSTEEPVPDAEIK